MTSVYFRAHKILWKRYGNLSVNDFVNHCGKARVNTSSQSKVAQHARTLLYVEKYFDTHLGALLKTVSFLIMNVFF